MSDLGTSESSSKRNRGGEAITSSQMNGNSDKSHNAAGGTNARHSSGSEIGATTKMAQLRGQATVSRDEAKELHQRVQVVSDDLSRKVLADQMGLSISDFNHFLDREFGRDEKFQKILFAVKEWAVQADEGMIDLTPSGYKEDADHDDIVKPDSSNQGDIAEMNPDDGNDKPEPASAAARGYGLRQSSKLRQQLEARITAKKLAAEEPTGRRRGPRPKRKLGSEQGSLCDEEELGRRESEACRVISSAVAAGRTQRDLTRDIGLNPGDLSRLLNGRYVEDRRSLIKVIDGIEAWRSGRPRTSPTVSPRKIGGRRSKSAAARARAAREREMRESASYGSYEDEDDDSDMEYVRGNFFGGKRRRKGFLIASNLYRR
eukprot:Rmarinus@m.29860